MAGFAFSSTWCHGWEISAMWDDLKFDFKNAKHIERCAIVGDRKWEGMMTKLFRPFFSAKIEYFDALRIDKAWKFVRRH